MCVPLRVCERILNMVFLRCHPMLNINKPIRIVTRSLSTWHSVKTMNAILFTFDRIGVARYLNTKWPCKICVKEFRDKDNGDEKSIEDINFLSMNISVEKFHVFVYRFRLNAIIVWEKQNVGNMNRILIDFHIQIQWQTNRNMPRYLSSIDINPFIRFKIRKWFLDFEMHHRAVYVR